MQTLNSILFATDLRADSQKALEVVGQLASAFGSRVDVLHVIEPLRYFENAAVQHLYTQQENERARDQLELARKELQERQANVGECRILQGSVADSIVATASELGADLVILGAGSVSSHRAVGATAQAVMEHSELPVMVVRSTTADSEAACVLCPVDHSRTSHRGLRNAIRLAKGMKASLVVLSVVPELSWIMAAADVGSLTDVQAEYAMKWAEELDRFLDGLDFQDVPYRLEVVRGAAHEQILEAAKKHHADLIVMGATGKSGLARVLLGSTTRRVLRDLPCSLLIVRQQGLLEENL